MAPQVTSPGVMPTRPSPSPGDVVVIECEGLPAPKDVHASIRNASHSHHARFAHLRERAIAAMDGRRWFDGPVRLDVTMRAPELDRSLNAYTGGIDDTLDGSHGVTFTFLPVCFQDDCQVCDSRSRFVQCDAPSYTVRVEFLHETGP